MTETRSPDPDAEPTDEDQPAVTAHTASSDRTVFTEQDNTDAWIATDVTVSLRR